MYDFDAGDALDAIGEKVRANTEAVLNVVNEQRRLPREAAVDLATRRGCWARAPGCVPDAAGSRRCTRSTTCSAR